MEELGVGFSSPWKHQGSTPEVLHDPSAMLWVTAFPPPHPIGNTISTCIAGPLCWSVSSSVAVGAHLPFCEVQLALALLVHLYLAAFGICWLLAAAAAVPSPPQPLCGVPCATWMLCPKALLGESCTAGKWGKQPVVSPALCVACDDSISFSCPWAQRLS